MAASVRRSSKRDISSLRRAVSVHVKIDAQRRILFDLFHSICCSSESFGINCFIESQTKSKCVWDFCVCARVQKMWKSVKADVWFLLCRLHFFFYINSQNTLIYIASSAGKILNSMFNHSRAHTNTHAKHTFFRCFVCDLIKLNALIGSKYISCDASHVRQRRRRRRRHTVHIRGSQIFCCPFKFVSFEYNVGNGNECELKGTWKWKKDSAKRDTSETEWEMAEERRRTVSWTFPMLIQWHVCHVCICFSFFHFVRTAIMCVCVCVCLQNIGRWSTINVRLDSHSSRWFALNVYF